MKINQEISELLNVFLLPQKDYEEICEYLEHNEWGIALEYLISTLLDQSIEISELIYLRIQEVGEFMELEAPPWEDLKQLVK